MSADVRKTGNGLQGLGRPLTAESREAFQLRSAERSLVGLADLCCNTLGLSLQYYRVQDSWAIGTLPDCKARAEALETQIRSLLGDAQILPAQFAHASRMQESVMSLRAVMGGTRYAAQLSWLLRQDSERAHLTPFVCEVGDAALLVAQKSVAALEQNDKILAREAVQLMRDLETTRKMCQIAVVNAEDFPVPARRITRAAIWSLAVAGGGMAEVSTRALLQEAQTR